MAGTDASRSQASGILTPTSDGSVHGQSAVSSLSGMGKRKRSDSVAMDHLLRDCIIIKVSLSQRWTVTSSSSLRATDSCAQPHPPNFHAQPHALQPLMLLPRQHLPLSAFDLLNPTGSLPQSRFYESHIKILDLESRIDSSPSVLLAQNDSMKAVFALERQNTGLYVICKLASSIDLDELRAKATVVSHEHLRPVKPEPGPVDRSNVVTTPQLHKEHKKKTAAIEAIQSLVRKRARSESLLKVEDVTGRSNDQGLANVAIPQAPGALGTQLLTTSSLQESAHDSLSMNRDQVPQSTAESIFDHIRRQYTEVLYRSKVNTNSTNQE